MYINIWSVFDYDVWGNETDGWALNDWWKIGELTIQDDDTEEVILSKLVDKGYIADAEGLTVNEMGECLLVVEKAQTGYPLCGLLRGMA